MSLIKETIKDNDIITMEEIKEETINMEVDNNRDVVQHVSKIVVNAVYVWLVAVASAICYVIDTYYILLIFIYFNNIIKKLFL